MPRLRSRMAATGLAAATLAGIASVAPPAAGPVRGADYELVTVAAYEVDPEAGEISVSVEVDFTNTTPNPPGRLSVFDEVKLAIHDQAASVAASDDEGELTVEVGVADDVNVATVELREGVQHIESAAFELTYTLPDTEEPRLRVRPSLIVFPAWSFGTAGSVRVSMPDGYEVRVDGDPLTRTDGAYLSGEIGDQSEWLALVTGLRPVELTSLSTPVPLAGGTVDLVINAFPDDEAWGTQMRDRLAEALPLIEAELGLPYPLVGELVVTEAVPVDATGFAEEAASASEILVAYDQPPFTALHQLCHVWISASFADARWIREGIASTVAARVAERMDIELPFDPVAATEDRAAVAFPLDEWPVDGGPDVEAYGYAASWSLTDALESAVGTDALRTVLRRVAAGIEPHQEASIEPEASIEGVGTPLAPLTSRSLLDHLEAVSGADLAPLFAELVLPDADVALLEERAAARDAFAALHAAADGWGTPDPVRASMTAWAFGEAQEQIAASLAWLEQRDGLLAEMSELGLAPSDRLQEAYRAYGGGAESTAQLEAHRTVVDAYADTAADVNQERTFVERIGLLGGPQPDSELGLANGRFASGDLRGSVEAITETQRILAAAETGGIVRLLSAALVIVLLLSLAFVLFRRRAAYTSGR